MPYFGDGANLSGISAVVKKVRTVEDTGTIGGNYSSYTNVLNIPSFTPNSTNSVSVSYTHLTLPTAPYV